MHKLFSILTILTLASCSTQNDSTIHSERQQNTLKNSFANWFANVDTSQLAPSVCCSQGVYKRINDQYVIHIFPDLPVQFDSCSTINIDRSNAAHLAELLIFDNKDANLANNCTDVRIVNNPEPTRQLQAESGQLVIGFSDPTELYGNKTQHTTILIKRLLFVDRSTGEKIEFENELLWKVLNTGTPG